MKVNYNDIADLKQARDLLKETIDKGELNDEAKGIELLKCIDEELKDENEHIDICNNLIHEICDLLNNNYCNMVCPLCEEKHIVYENHNGTHIYKCQECPMFAFELIEKKDEENIIDYLGGGSDKKLLWELQQDYLDELERRRNRVQYNEITLKELLDLGFNSNYLETAFYGTIELGWKNEDGTYDIEWNEEQLNVRVKMTEDFYEDETCDSDDYEIMRVVCVDSKDDELFVEEE